MSWRFIVDERGIETRLMIDADGRGEIYQSHGLGIMYALIYKRIKRYLDIKYGDKLENYMMAQSRTRRVIGCWDGKPEISDTYK